MIHCFIFRMATASLSLLLKKSNRVNYNRAFLSSCLPWFIQPNVFVTNKPLLIVRLCRESVDLFGAEPLGIFPPPSAGSAPKMSSSLHMPTWDSLAAHSLESSLQQSPANHWQELIQWTNQGKVWTFPIDNEVGEFLLLAGKNINPLWTEFFFSSFFGT